MVGGVVVSLALDDPTLAPDPTWTDITAAQSSFVASISIDRGRVYELDQTDTSTATVEINDREGILDPTNVGGPYFSSDPGIQPLIQAKIELLNPVTDELTTIFRGYVEDFDYAFDSSQRVNKLTLSLVDAFAILSAIEMQGDGTFGDPLPPDVTGIFFDDNEFVGKDTGSTTGRMFQVLGNAGWPTELQVLFTGNVSIQEAIYSPGETVLDVIQDAADAEFPGVANVYVDKIGRIVFHGRRAKFDPAAVAAEAGPDAWDFQQWIVGDGAKVTASPDTTAQIRVFAINFGLSKVINYASASPQNMTALNADPADQIVQDPTSIGVYGVRSWSKENLQTDQGSVDGLGTLDETRLFAQFYIDNYAVPRRRISQISFKSMYPEDERAAANWALLCGVEIADQVNVFMGSPGGGGLSDVPFFVEGVHYDIQPLQPGYAFVTLTLDLSPQAYYSTNPFTDV